MQVDVLTSGIWQTNTTILSHRGGCLVIDPAYFPRELDAITARACELGRTEAVVFTHGHWDHVMGHTALPGVPVWVSQSLEISIATADPRAAQYLEDARAFDSRWYVPRPHGHHWPAQLRGIADDERLELADIVMRAVHLPGHSVDGLGLVAEHTGLLLVGDYLSPCEIPFVDDAHAYRATLLRLIELASHARDIIPGHGARLTSPEAVALANADLEYLDRLIEVAARGDRAAAAAIPFPRAVEVVGMRDHHVENCQKLGLG